MLWDLFLTFFKIGFVSFGGGYAMIPLIQQEAVERHHWMTTSEFSDVIATAGMSPGPIAANSAVFIGYSQMGFPGAMLAAAGMMLPSLLIILLIGSIFYKVQDHRIVKSAFYGLRAVITGLIIYAALLFAQNNGLFASWNWHMASQWLIYACCLIALFRYRMHPVHVILLSGLVGIAVYS